jgi:hypothetical protein
MPVIVTDGYGGEVVEYDGELVGTIVDTTELVGTLVASDDITGTIEG